MNVPERMREYIDEHHLKQISIARASGISKTAFSAIMTGRRKLYVDEFERICSALNVAPEYFFTSDRNTA